MADKEREQELLAIIAELNATVAKLREELAESNRKIAELQEALNTKKHRKDSHTPVRLGLDGAFHQQRSRTLRQILQG